MPQCREYLISEYEIDIVKYSRTGIRRIRLKICNYTVYLPLLLERQRKTNCNRLLQTEKTFIKAKIRPSCPRIATFRPFSYSKFLINYIFSCVFFQIRTLSYKNSIRSNKCTFIPPENYFMSQKIIEFENN